MQFSQPQINAVAAVAKTKAAGNPKWTRAIERAAAGFQSGEFCVTLLSGYALVTSPRGSYRVNGHCECDASRRGHSECKHRAAVRLVEMLDAEPVATKAATSVRVPTITRSVERDHTGVRCVAVYCNGWAI